MKKDSFLAIEFKFSDFMPWTVIYKTTCLDDLISTYKYLTKENNPLFHYRLSVFH